MPLVGIFSANPRQIGTGAFRTPLEGVVIHALRRQAVMAVAFDFIAQGADLLAMTDIAAFAHIDVAALEFQRRIGTHAADLLHRAAHPEQRSDFHGAADGDHQDDADQQEDGVLFQPGVVHYTASAARTAGVVTGTPWRTVFHKL